MTTRRLTFVSGGLIVAILAAIVAIVAFNGTSSAQTDEPVTDRPSVQRPDKLPKDPNALLAVAIGTISHDGDDSPDTIDLRVHESAESKKAAPSASTATRWATTTVA